MRITWLAVAVFALALVMRGAFPTADPPAEKISGIGWADEGRWTHNARNKVLFEAWQADQYNASLFLSPPFTFAAYATFVSLGVGTWQARLPSLVAGMALLIVFYALLKHEHGERVGLVGLVLAGTDYMMIMYSRVALVEMLLLFLMVLCAYCFMRGYDLPGYAAAAGVAAGAVGITKSSGMFFLAAPLLASLVLMMRQREEAEKWCEARRLGLYLAGLALTGITWVVFWLIPNWEDSVRLQQLHAGLYSPKGPTGYVLQGLIFPFAHPVFARILPATIVGLFTAWITLRVVVARAGPLRNSSLLFVVWLILGVPMIVAFDLYNQRRYLMVLPPLFGLAAQGLIKGFGLDAEGRRELPGPILMRLVLGGVALYGLYWMYGAVFRATVELIGTEYRFRHLMVAAGGAAVVTWVIARHLSMDRVMVGVRSLMRQMTTVLILATIIGINFWHYADWAWRRSYTIPETSRALADLIPPGAYVLGDAAVSLALENRMRPLFVHEWYGRLDGANGEYSGASARAGTHHRSGVRLDPVQQAQARFILVHGNAAEEPDAELHRLLTQTPPGPPLREFTLYDGYRPGEHETVLLFRRRNEEPPS